MKLIIAIIQPSKLEDVKAALSEVEVVRLTIMDVQGFGRQKGQTEMYRGREITLNLLRKVQLQIAVNEDFVEPTVNAIIEAARAAAVIISPTSVGTRKPPPEAALESTRCSSSSIMSLASTPIAGEAAHFQKARSSAGDESSGGER